MMAMKKHDTYRGELKLNEPMSKHTSWRVGGPADRFYTPADEADLANYVASLPSHEPLLWLGLGSNLLVRDGGIRGTVISLQGSLSEMRVLDGNRIQAPFALHTAGVCTKKRRHLPSRLIQHHLRLLSVIMDTRGIPVAVLQNLRIHFQHTIRNGSRRVVIEVVALHC